MTIRENILYGLPLDKERYVDTIRICELEQDLDSLKAGDQTEIGEKGINLSGGQKARISLARAVYSNQDIFLMDDPISAVDAIVRKKLFVNCIMKYLAGKTRVLATHAIDFLHMADRVAIIDNGRIVAVGTFDQLQENEQLKHLISINKLETTEEQSNAINQNSNSGKRSNESSEEEVVEELSPKEKLERFEKYSKNISKGEGKIIQDENEEIVDVTWEDYSKFVKYSGGMKHMVFIIVFCAIFYFSEMALVWYIGQWTKDGIKQKSENRKYTLIVFFIALINAISFVTRWLYQVVIKNALNQKIHDTMIKNVMRAPINLYYDTTPLGQIQNRFSKDLGGCRDIIETIGNLSMDFIRLGCIISVLAYANWYIIILVPFMLAGSISMYKFTVPAVVQGERVLSIVRSPVLNNLNECISGCSTIRAYGTQQRFIDLQLELQHKQLLCMEALGGMWNYFHIRNKVIAMIMMISSCTGCLLYRHQEDPVVLAMLLTYIIQLAWTFDCIMGNSQWLERQMVSLRRCFKMFEIDQERDEQAKVPIS